MISKQRNVYWKDIVLQASGNTIAQFVGIIFMPLLTRLYSPESFALQAIFIQSVVLLSAFVTFRFEYFLQLTRSNEEANSLILWILRVGLVMTIVLSVIILLLDKYDVFIYFGIESSEYFYLAPLTAYVVCVSLAFQNEAQRQGNFKTTSVSAVTTKVGYLSSGILLSFFTHTLGLILTTVFGGIGKLITLRKYLTSFISNINIRTALINKSFITIYKNRSIGMIFSNSILAITSLLPILFITKHYGTETLGQFALVLSTIFLPSGLIGQAVGNVFYQRSATIWNNRDYQALTLLWKETIFKLLIFALPSYIFLYFISPIVYPFIFGAQWQQAGQFAALMSLAAFFSFLAGPVDRLSLVLDISYYLPLIHVIRFIIVFLVIFISYTLNLIVTDFILSYSIGMSLVYVLDITLTRFFYMKRKSRDVV